MEEGQKLGNRFVVFGRFNPSVPQGAARPWPQTGSVDSSCLGSAETKEQDLLVLTGPFRICHFNSIWHFIWFFSLVEQPESWDCKLSPGSLGRIPDFGVLALQESWPGCFLGSWALTSGHATQRLPRSSVSVRSEAVKRVWATELSAPVRCFQWHRLFSRPAVRSKRQSEWFWTEGQELCKETQEKIFHCFVI